MHVRVLTIAGLDPCAGAGMTADARLVQSKGGDVAAVPTCLTVQNRHGFGRAEPVPAEWLRDALAAVFDDGPVHAVKIGMVADPKTAEVIEAALRGKDLPIVLDPVLSASAGGYQTTELLVAALRDRLAPIATLVTPNAHELGALGGLDSLVSVCSVLVTGGDAAGEDVIDELFERGQAPRTFRNPRIPRQRGVHGTGCALSTSVAFYLGGGAPLAIACAAAIDDVRQCIAATPDGGPGSVEPLRVVG